VVLRKKNWLFAIQTVKCTFTFQLLFRQQHVRSAVYDTPNIT